MNHQPDWPFGCPATWGKPLAIWGRYDCRLHVCNLPDAHDGNHICKCQDSEPHVKSDDSMTDDQERTDG